MNVVQDRLHEAVLTQFEQTGSGAAEVSTGESQMEGAPLLQDESCYIHRSKSDTQSC